MFVVLEIRPPIRFQIDVSDRDEKGRRRDRAEARRVLRDGSAERGVI